MVDLYDQLQATLGSTYTLERELGGGGMSRVFVAREVALGRLVVVKVLPPELAVDVNIGRFRREIQLVAQLQHPHIVPVLAACEVGSLPYFTMPFVEGESLRARLARGGALSIPDAVRTLRDVAKALAYAHRHGVVHRDIKPENILLSDGTALVTDFGVAKALSAAATGSSASTFTSTSRGMALGTPAYMAPEQVAADPTVDYRADLYAFGVVAYELLTGRTPFADRSPRQMLAAHIAEPPEPVDSLRAATPPALAALVMRCLEKHPADRPESAVEVLRELEATPTPNIGTVAGTVAARRARTGGPLPADARRRRAPMLYAALLALVAAFAAGFALRHVHPLWPTDSLLASGAMKERDPVIVDDFSSPPTDTLLGRVVSEAIRTDLGQSRVVTVVQPSTVREVLARMRRADATRLDLALASEVAQRSGTQVVVDGDVAAVGQGYVLTARLVTADSGNTLAAFRETAEDSRQIIPAIDRLSQRLRTKVGESVRSVRASPPLEQVTTSSLEALRKYAQAVHAMDVDGDYPKGETLLTQAVALDSAFAMAYRKLGISIANAGGSVTQRNDAFRRAYAHPDRLSKVERSLTAGTYYTYVAYDAPRAISAYEAVLDVQPDNAIALNNVGALYQNVREYAKSADYLRRAIRLQPRASPAYTNLALLQLSLGDTAGARHTLDQMAARLPPGHPDAAFGRSKLALAVGQYDSAAAIARAAERTHRGNPEVRDGVLGELIVIAAVHGKLRECARLLREQAILDQQRGRPSKVLEDELALAWGDIWFRHDQARGLRRADSIVAAHPLDALPPLDRPYLTLARLYAEGGRPRRARALLAEMQAAVPAASRADPDDEFEQHDVLGRIALAEGRVNAAIAEFRLSDGGACRVCALPNLARAYDLAGNADSTIAIYRRYIETPDAAHAELDAMFLAGAYRRLGERYEARGQREEAVVAYTRFVRLWKDADPELQPVVMDVRRRLAGLGGDRAGAL